MKSLIHSLHAALRYLARDCTAKAATDRRSLWLGVESLSKLGYQRIFASDPHHLEKAGRFDRMAIVFCTRGTRVRKLLTRRIYPFRVAEPIDSSIENAWTYPKTCGLLALINGNVALQANELEQLNPEAWY